MGVRATRRLIRPPDRMVNRNARPPANRQAPGWRLPSFSAYVLSPHVRCNPASPQKHAAPRLLKEAGG
jgi:hypothetical protein